jgi:hypothetical protein
MRFHSVGWRMVFIRVIPDDGIPKVNAIIVS